MENQSKPFLNFIFEGCDSGLGQEYVRKLSMHGFQVFAGCLFPDGDGAKELLERSSNSSRIRVIGLDVTSEDCIERALNEVTSILNRDKLQLFGIVNNAGLGPTNVFEWSDIEEDIIKTFQVNVFGMMKVCQAFLPLLRQCVGGARIVNIASIAGREGVPQQTPCCSSKASVIAFSTTIRRELRRFNIKVITIEPYFFSTGLNSFQTIATSLRRGWKGTSEDTKKFYGQEYLKSWLVFYESILCKTYCKDLNIASNTVLKSLTNKFAEEVYVAIPLIQGMIIWAHLTLLPLHIHELLYKLLDQVIKYFYLVCRRYQTTDSEKEKSVIALPGNKKLE